APGQIGRTRLGIPRTEHGHPVPSAHELPVEELRRERRPVRVWDANVVVDDSDVFRKRGAPSTWIDHWTVRRHDGIPKLTRADGGAFGVLRRQTIRRSKVRANSSQKHSHCVNGREARTITSVWRVW